MKDSATQSTPLQSDLTSTQPAWLDRLATHAVLRMLRRFNGAPMRLLFPDGQQHLAGRPDSSTEPADLRIHHPRFFRRVLLQGEIGFGEAYMEGDWSTPDLPGLITALIGNLESIPGMSGSSRRASLSFHILKGLNRLAHWRRRNTPANSRRNISEHYDLSNEFYSLWLDDSLTYSSAFFTEEDQPLAKAQENKYDRLCRKLELQPGQKVLEIGCGWGGFSLHAARHYGVQITAITISRAQFEKARQRVNEAGMADRITVLLTDYRQVQGAFDAIVSIEMLEAVGHDFLKSYFSQCHRLLKKEGRLGLQVIVCPDSRYETMRRSVDWIKKHIFPGGQLPSIKALVDSVNATGDLYLQHLENFGFHYARTLHLWRTRFNDHRRAVTELGFDDAFQRKWNYYLAYCEAAFASRNINVAQLVLARPNNPRFAPERILH